MRMLHFANGDGMPAVGLGTWQATPGEVGQAVQHALRLGYRHIDCAAIYGNEPEIGRGLAEAEVPRSELWITSKLWNDMHAPEDVRTALEKTLADLGVDYLDLYLIHWPVVLRKSAASSLTGADYIPLDDMPLTETWHAMEAAVDAGLCRHIGVSNFSAHKLGALLQAASRKPEVNQVELHPYLQQRDLVDFCTRHGVHVTAYSPLGAPHHPEPPRLIDDATIARIGAKHEATPAQVVLAWGALRGTSVIPKSVRPERLAENLAAADVALTADDMREIAALDRHHRYVDGAFWTGGGSPYTLANLWDE